MSRGRVEGAAKQFLPQGGQGTRKFSASSMYQMEALEIPRKSTEGRVTCIKICMNVAEDDTSEQVLMLHFYTT